MFARLTDAARAATTYVGGVIERVGEVIDQLSPVVGGGVEIAKAINDVQAAPRKMKEEIQNAVDDVTRTIPEIKSALQLSQDQHQSAVGIDNIPLVGNTVALLKNQLRANNKNKLKVINKNLQDNFSNHIEEIKFQLEVFISAVSLLDEKLKKYIASSEKNKSDSQLSKKIDTLRTFLQQQLNKINLQDVATLSPAHLAAKMHDLRLVLDFAANRLIDLIYTIPGLIEGVSRAKNTVSHLRDMNLLFWWAQHSAGVSQLFTAPKQYFSSKTLSLSMMSHDSAYFESSLRWMQRSVWALSTVDFLSAIGIAAKAAYQSRDGFVQMRELLRVGLANEVARIIKTILPPSSDWSADSKAMRMRMYRELRLLLVEKNHHVSDLVIAIQNIITNMISNIVENASYSVTNPLFSVAFQLLSTLTMPMSAYRHELSTDVSVRTTYMAPGLYRVIAEAMGFREYDVNNADSLYLLESQLLTPLLYWTEMSIYRNIFSGFFATSTAKYAIYKVRTELDRMVASGELAEIVRESLDSILKTTLLNADEINDLSLGAIEDNTRLRESVHAFVKLLATILTEKSNSLKQAVTQPEPLTKSHQLYGKAVDTVVTNVSSLFSLFSRSSPRIRDESNAAVVGNQLRI